MTVGVVGAGTDPGGTVGGLGGLGVPRAAGPSTPGGDSSPDGSCGVGSKETQLPSMRTSGQE